MESERKKESMAQNTGADDDDSVDKILTRMHFKNLVEDADLENYVSHQRSQQNRQSENVERQASGGQGRIGAGGGNRSRSEDSLYDSDDGESDLFDRDAIEDDEDDEDGDIENDELLHGNSLSGAFVTWNEIAAQQRQMNRRRVPGDEEEEDENEDQEMEDNDQEESDGMMVDDDDDDDDDDDEEDQTEDDQAHRANRMQVVNAAGQVLGAYLPPRAMPLGDAYNHLNPPPPPPAFLKEKASRDDVPAPMPYETEDRRATDSGATKSNNKRTREDGNERDVSSLTSLMKELNLDANDPAMKTLLQKVSGRTDQDRYESGGGRKRNRIDITGDNPESLSDNDYITKHFADFLKSSNITAKQLCDLFCPTCGFGNLINEEPVRADVYEKIQKIMEVGVMSISVETTAFIASELWNDGIYRPMKAANKRMLPLTYKMAYEHLTRPHRPDPRPDHRSDIEMLTTTAKNASALIFYQDSLTGRIRYDYKAYNMMASALRLKNILRKTLPEKMAYYNPRLDHNNAAATGLVNPMRTVRYASTGTASAMGKSKNSGLGGRQVNRK